ncbi:MAG: HflC protein [Rhizobiales bacterium NRL2]|jgi:membrane protease subunit HflC|nr:MAG: HflC protein [Rhizobiales bacterium NRL2]
MKTAGIILGVIVLIVGIVAWSSIFTVHQTQRAIVLQFGNPVRIVNDPGIDFKVPFVQDVVFVEKRILSLDADPEEIITQDQKRMVVDVFTRYRITDPLEFIKAYTNMLALEDRLDTIVRSTLRDILGDQPFTSLLSGERSVLMSRLSRRVNDQMSQNGVEIVDVRIKRADLPEQNKEAIFNRMRTEREREAREERALGDEEAQRIRAKADRDKTVLLAEARKQSEILRGEGDGTRAAIFNSTAEQYPDFYAFYRSLQAYRQSLKGDDTTMVLSPTSEFFRYFEDISVVDPDAPPPAVTPGGGIAGPRGAQPQQQQPAQQEPAQAPAAD